MKPAPLALLLLLSACGPPPAREPDPWEKDWNAASEPMPGNVRVTIQVFQISETDREGWNLFWGASIPVGSGRLSVNGLRAATGGPEFFARLDAWQKNETTRRRTEQFIEVADGGSASFDVGEMSREPVRIVYYDAGVVVDTFDWTRAGCSLEVAPRVLPDGRVEVKLHPSIAHREGNGSTRFAELVTTATVKSGDAVIIGGSDSAEGTIGGSFFSRWESNRRYRTVFVLRVRTR